MRIARKQVAAALITICLLLIAGIGYWNHLRRSAAKPLDRATTAKTAEALSVQVARPERRDVSRQISLPATLEAFQQTTLYAKTSGYLKWIKVDIGDRVTKGQVIAQLDVPEMGKEYEAAGAETQSAAANVENMQAEAERAKAELELKRITYERYKSIREEDRDVIPQQQVDEAKAQYDVARANLNVAESKIKVAKSQTAESEAARARLSVLMEYANIRAPFSGIVIKRHVDPGALIQQATSQTNVSPVVTISQIDTMRVFIEVNEAEIRFIKRGSPATLTIDALPGVEFKGNSTRYTSALDPKTRTMKTEIDIPNRNGMLRPGMFGSVKLTLELHDNALTVPASALISQGTKSYVYTVVDNKVKRVEVQTGFDDGSTIEITGGLSDNDLLIMSGKSEMQDGTPVKVDNAK